MECSNAGANLGPEHGFSEANFARVGPSIAMTLSTHTIRVTRLYRAALKNLMYWTVHRDLFIEKSLEMRAGKSPLRMPL